MENKSTEQEQETVLGKSDTLRCFVVSVNGCDDSTIFDMEMTEQEFEFLKKVQNLTIEKSTYGCMPILIVEPK